MEIKAATKYARISPTKARDLANSIAGLSVSEALKITEFSPRKGAFLIGKTLRSAIANAENNAKLSADTLRVKEAIVDPGPTLKRYRFCARGRVHPIRKRTSHIKITLTDEGGQG